MTPDSGAGLLGAGHRNPRYPFDPYQRNALAVGRPMRISHVAFEVADFANLAAPRLLHHIQLHLPMRVSIGKKCQPPIGRPCETLHPGGHVTDTFGTRVRILQIFDVNSDAGWIAGLFTRRGFNPRYPLVVRGKSDLVKLMQ